MIDAPNEAQSLVGYLQQGNYTQAQLCCDRLLQRVPGSVDLLLAKISILVQEGKIEQAGRVAQALYRYAPTDPRVADLHTLFPPHSQDELVCLEAAQLLQKNPREVAIRGPYACGEGTFGMSVLSDAQVLGQFSLVCKDNAIVAESIPITYANDLKPGMWSEAHLWSVVDSRSLGEKGPLMLMSGMWDQNFFHWVYDYLPRAIMAEQCGFTGRYLVNEDLPRFAFESLALIGISGERIVTKHRCESLLVPELWLADPKPACIQQKEQWVPKLLRETLLSRLTPQSNPAKRVYLSRRKASRTVTNEAALQDLLATRYGFTTYLAEDLTFAEQVQIFSQAEVFVGPHGAGMIHALWMPQNCLVLELFSPTYVNPCCLPAMQLQEHRYFMIPSYCNGTSLPENREVTAFLEVVDLTLARELKGR